MQGHDAAGVRNQQKKRRYEGRTEELSYQGQFLLFFSLSPSLSFYFYLSIFYIYLFPSLSSSLPIYLSNYFIHKHSWKKGGNANFLLNNAMLIFLCFDHMSELSIMVIDIYQ